jgi:hypothetical protein
MTIGTKMSQCAQFLIHRFLNVQWLLSRKKRSIDEALRNEQDTARRPERPPRRAALSAALVHALVRRRHDGSALRQSNRPTTGCGLTTAQLSTYAVDIVVVLCGQSVTYFSNLFSDWVMNHLLSPSVRPAYR